jgi:ABC-type amino acid transport system permease subunit
MAEVIRGGILSVSKTQMDAARSSGLGYLRAMWHVILPQAFRNMLPAIINRFIALFMGTSLVYIIGVTEFFRAANNINNRVFQSYVIYGFVAAVYFVCCYGLSLIGQHLLERLDPASRASTERVLPRPSASA